MNDTTKMMMTKKSQEKYKSQEKKREIESSIYLNKYERSEVISKRAQDIENGAALILPLLPGEHCALKIAERELEMRVIPYSVVRSLHDGTKETVPVSDLFIRAR